MSTCQSAIMLNMLNHSASQSRSTFPSSPSPQNRNHVAGDVPIFPVEARTCGTGTPPRLPQLFVALRHSLSRACLTKDHTKRPKKVRRKSEGYESPELHQNFSFFFFMRSMAAGTDLGHRLRQATPEPGSEPGLPGLRPMP